MTENDTAGKLAAGGETAESVETQPAAGAGTDGAAPVAAAPGGAATGTKPASEEEVREALYDVVDPELGIDVVNLGLIYGIHIDDSNVATLDMTLTSAACPLTDVIEDQAKAATDGIVNELKINWVWMPPWGPDKITDDGREQLRALGFNV
ncbi:metal-sulfur cluster assembly factor [Streptomyces ficellus]|uniref:Metal-sulfur cluster assembly factor n=1 Tax=Streptomyces ficellus TaxID=1977088 RepID=A0A6I6FDW4_9ACTN|nr:metal-sulfur cluster assembly factor [Streptomyces ficellus]